MSTEPITHLEQVVAGTTTPVTHLEQVVAGTAPPVTHLEHVISENSGGGSATLIEKTITQNGVYNAADDSADGYSKVTANVPNSYEPSDEGKVVSSGALVAQSSGTATQNGTVDTTLINSLTVAVQNGPVYTPVSAVTMNPAGNTVSHVIFLSWTNVKKFEFLYKLATYNVQTDNAIVICADGSAPFVNYPSSNGVSLSTKEIVDGYAHIVGTFDTAQTKVLWIGSWTDLNYTKAMVIKNIKLWDRDDQLVFDATPAEDAHGRGAFYDAVSKQLYYTEYFSDLIAGEGV